MDWISFWIVTGQLFAITDPIGNLPIFYGITKNLDDKERRSNFMTAVVFAFSLLILFTFLGDAILGLFHISMADFKIAGGVLLLVIAVMILVRGSWEAGNKEHGQAIGAVPLGCPLLVGPGAIATAMVAIGMYGPRLTLLAIAANFIASFLILFYGDTILKYIGKNGTEIIGRVMVILLASIAVSFIHSGIAAWVIDFARVTIR